MLMGMKYCLLCAVVYSLCLEIGMHIYVEYSIVSMILILIPAVWIVINIEFNYILAVFTSSNHTQPHTSDKLCEKCCNGKPERTHHCSICNVCVLKMDHHCPWINNCVGLRNHRYFLLFVSYVWIGSWYYLLLSWIFRDAVINELSSIVSLVFGITMTLFGGWSWYLACVNSTTIEVISRQTPNVELKLKTVLDNLNIIFGTRNVIKILAPSIRSLPVNGIDWHLYEVLVVNP